MGIIVNNRQYYTDFDEYIRQGEPSQREKASIWQTAIGLQAVDGLLTSDYLKATACKHIEGEIDIDEARELIRSYYQSKTQREPDDDEKQEADKVSANITKILSSQTLDFSTGGYISVHRRVFDGVFKHAGKLRVNPAKRNVLDLKNETCKNREKRNVLKISHTRHFKTTKKQSKTGCFYSF